MGWNDRIAERRRVGVVVERHALASRWATHRWHPGAVLAAVPETAAWTEIENNGGIARFYAGEAELELVPSETEGYRFNLESRTPSAWVVLRSSPPGDDGRDIELLTVTVSPSEAEARSGVGDDVIEAVPLPPEIAAWMIEFVAHHHVDRPRFKRKRNPYVSEGQALAEAERSGDDDE